MSKRDEYVAKMKVQLDRWNADVTKWEARAREAQAAARPEFEKQLAAFRKQRDVAMQQMHKVQAAAGEAWVELVHGTDEAWARMREAFEKASSHFQKK